MTTPTVTSTATDAATVIHTAADIARKTQFNLYQPLYFTATLHASSLQMLAIYTAYVQELLLLLHFILIANFQDNLGKLV